MTKLVVDAAMQAKLKNLNGPLELCDETGRTLGYFHPVTKEQSGSGNHNQSPFTGQELERRRQQLTGRSLTEILEGLKQS